MFRLFSLKSKSIKNWRSRAWSIDPQKTKLIITKTKKSVRHVTTVDTQKIGKLELIPVNKKSES